MASVENRGGGKEDNLIQAARRGEREGEDEGSYSTGLTATFYAGLLGRWREPGLKSTTLVKL